MADYKKMYYTMFNAGVEAEKMVCEARDFLLQAQRLIYKASDTIRKAQKECEELYIGDEQEQAD